MEEIRKKATIRIEHRDGELVGSYRPSDREVVGVLTHEKPLSGRTVSLETPIPRKKKKMGLWIFLLCAAVLVGVSVGAYFIHGSRRKCPPAAITVPEALCPVEMTNMTLPYLFPAGRPLPASGS